MGAGAHLVQRGEVEDPPQVGDAAGVHDGGAYVVDELFGDQVLNVPDRVHHLADRDRCRRVLPDEPEGLLVLGRGGVLHPEQPAALDALAEPRGLDRGQPVVHVVQQMEAEAEAFPHGLQIARREAQVGLGVPRLLVGQLGRGGLVHGALAHPVRPSDVGHGRLRAYGLVAQLQIALDVVQQGGHVGAAGVRIHQHAVPGTAAEELVDREAGRLALDVPQRRVDRGDRRHGDGPAPPVGALVEVLPHVLDAGGVPADQQGGHVVAQIARDGQLTAVEGGVAESRHPVRGGHAERDEGTAGRGDEDLDTFDCAHSGSLPIAAPRSRSTCIQASVAQYGNTCVAALRTMGPWLKPTGGGRVGATST